MTVAAAGCTMTVAVGVQVVGRVGLRPSLHRLGWNRSSVVVDLAGESSGVVDVEVGDLEVGIVLDEHLRHMDHGTEVDPGMLSTD
jgi:hypothetical protein